MRGYIITVMKTAIIHEWLVTEAGAESVLQSIFHLFPGDIHALFHDPEGLRDTQWQNISVITSMLQRIPGARHHHRMFLPLYPMAIEQFDLRDYNLVISSSYAVAKGVLTSSDQLHICYCHSPIRYVWDLTFQYLETAGLSKGLRSFIIRAVLHYLRLWDAVSAQRVNRFVANSHYIAHRIEKCYKRNATVIYPPVDVDRFRVVGRREDYFITVSRLVPYKRVDLAVRAFNELGLKLLVLGDGPDMKRLKQIAKRNITLLGHVSAHEIEEYLSKARAFVFCAEEDFGIVNVEAQASGIPVLAYGKGGALETVVEKRTGLFFYEQTVSSLKSSVKEFLSCEESFDPGEIRKNAERFPRARFEKEFRELVEEEWDRCPYKQ